MPGNETAAMVADGAAADVTTEKVAAATVTKAEKTVRDDTPAQSQWEPRQHTRPSEDRVYKFDRMTVRVSECASVRVCA